MDKLQSLGLIQTLGYTPLDAEGKPHRPSRSGYSWQKNLTSPPRIYTTEAKAAAQSPVKTARQVFMFVDNLPKTDTTSGFPK